MKFKTTTKFFQVLTENFATQYNIDADRLDNDLRSKETALAQSSFHW